MKIEKFGFDIVHGCQLKCIGCPLSTRTTKIQYATLDNVRTILDNVDVQRVRLLRLFNFGESLLHPQLPEILEIIKSNRRKYKLIEISTNAQYYNEERLTEAFKVGVIDKFYVSCDGNGTPKVYERLRTPAKWDKLMSFLKNVKILRDKYCPEMELKTRTICDNEKDQHRWKKILMESKWHPEFRTMNNFPESKVVEGKNLSIPKGICKFLNKDTGGYRLYVDFDGTVVPCCRHPRAIVLGNMLENKYTEMLKSRQYRDILKQMKWDRMTIPVCNECDHS